MTERGRGAVIQVASSVAFQPIPVQSVYSASKAFVLHFSEATAAELKGTGVTMTALCPGPVKTEFVEAAGFKKGEQEMAPSIMWSTAEEVAKAGLDAADKGKRVVVPGITNRVTDHLRAPRPEVDRAGADVEHVPPRNRRVALQPAALEPCLHQRLFAIEEELEADYAAVTQCGDVCRRALGGRRCPFRCRVIGRI